MSKKIQTEDSFFDIPEENTELVNAAFPDEIIQDEPSRSSVEWQEYLMGLFGPGEVIEINGKQCPTANALERLTRALVGNVIRQGVVDIKYSTVPAPKVVVIYEVELDLYDWPGKTTVVRDVASVWEANTDDLFLGYQEETACTRAKGRCFKTALGYNGVSFEELTREKNVAESVRKIKALDDKPTDGSFNEKESITERQSNFIMKVSKELNIDINKYISFIRSEKDNNALKNINISKKEGEQAITGISKSEASDYFIKVFNLYKQGEKQVPEVVLQKD